MTQATVAAGCVYRLARAAAERGIDVSKLPCAPPPLTSMSDVERRMPYDDLLTLWELVMRRVDDPAFPVLCGQGATPREYDVVGFACMTRATIGEGLDQAVRFSRLWSDAARWSIRKDPGGAVALCFDAIEVERLGSRCASEAFMVEMVHAGRMLSGVCYAPSAVRFRHPRPGDGQAHDAFFGVPVAWGAGRTEAVVSPEVLALPLLKADPALADFFERHALALLERFGSDATIARRLRAVLTEELPRGLPTLESAAAALATSTRTLRRRLQEDGTSFQAVLGEVRCELAKRYLAAPRLAVGEVAFLLGFSEPSTFHRAFKRWTGVTPQAFRRAAHASAA